MEVFISENEKSLAIADGGIVQGLSKNDKQRIKDGKIVMYADGDSYSYVKFYKPYKYCCRVATKEMIEKLRNGNKKQIEGVTMKKTMLPEIITLQQETAFAEYQEQVREEAHLDLPSMEFWDWYALWCSENGLHHDRASYQKDK